jgi:MYXO-CTERM domain-containing protein
MQALVFGQAPGASAHRAPFMALWLLGIAIAIARSRRRPDTQSP